MTSKMWRRESIRLKWKGMHNYDTTSSFPFYLSLLKSHVSKGKRMVLKEIGGRGTFFFSLWTCRYIWNQDRIYVVEIDSNSLGKVLCVDVVLFENGKKRFFYGIWIQRNVRIVNDVYLPRVYYGIVWFFSLHFGLQPWRHY